MLLNSLVMLIWYYVNNLHSGNKIIFNDIIVLISFLIRAKMIFIIYGFIILMLYTVTREMYHSNNWTVHYEIIIII